jgi:RNA polymerase sigma-70 factor (ECF subfamily)
MYCSFPGKEEKKMTLRTPRPRDVDSTLPDEEVVARVLLGETWFYGSLVQRHNPRFYKVLWNIVRSHEAVEDVMQQAHAQALTHLRQFAGRSSFITWLSRIMINEAYAYLRRRRVFQPLDPIPDELDGRPMQLASGARDPEQDAFQAELRGILEAAVDSLPELYRVVFTIRAIGEASTAEAAARLGITEQCVKTRMLRARRLLQKNVSRVAPAWSFPLSPGVKSHMAQ